MELKDGNLVIRTIQEEDVYPLWKMMYKDYSEWMKWNGPYFHDPIYSQEEFIKFIGPNYYIQQEHIGLIEVDDEICGTISYHFEDGELRQWLEFGLVVHKADLWGQKIGKRSCLLWIDFLFRKFPTLPHVAFTTWSGNQRMLHLGDSLGMKLEAQIRKVRYYDNQYWDSIKYGILREEFDKLQTKNND